MNNHTALFSNDRDLFRLLSICQRQLGTGKISEPLHFREEDREGLLTAAVTHGLLGPLQRLISNTPYLDNIHVSYLNQAARNFELAEALNKIVAFFADHAIEVAVLKGPAVALLTFGAITYREFNDLDLLIHRGHLPQAQRLLSLLGYRKVRGSTEADGEKDIVFVNDTTEILVELHWALNPSADCYPLEATGVWNRLQTLTLLNKPIQTLGLEDTLIYLCIHGSKHEWVSLKWSFDIAQLLQKHTHLDWDSIAKRCAAIGATRALAVGLGLACDLFAINTLGELPAIRSHTNSMVRIVNRLRQYLIHDQPFTIKERFFYHIHIHDRIWDRLFVAVTYSAPDIPRLMPVVPRQVTRSRIRFVTRPIRLFFVCGFDWVRAVLS